MFSWYKKASCWLTYISHIFPLQRSLLQELFYFRFFIIYFLLDYTAQSRSEFVSQSCLDGIPFWGHQNNLVEERKSTCVTSKVIKAAKTINTVFVSYIIKWSAHHTFLKISEIKMMFFDKFLYLYTEMYLKHNYSKQDIVSIFHQ